MEISIFYVNNFVNEKAHFSEFDCMYVFTCLTVFVYFHTKVIGAQINQVISHIKVYFYGN